MEICLSVCVCISSHHLNCLHVNIAGANRLFVKMDKHRLRSPMEPYVDQPGLTAVVRRFVRRAGVEGGEWGRHSSQLQVPT